MKTKVLLVGHKGNMGQRYGLILDHLKVDWIGCDLGDEWRKLNGVTHVILATPTDTHTKIIDDLLETQCPPKSILCEKPIALDSKKVASIDAACEEKGVKLSMVAQYRHLPKHLKTHEAKSHYKYFKHGDDGLFWDCIQIIGMHQGQWKDLDIDEKSFLWSAMSNGCSFNLSDMDETYLVEIIKWLGNEKMVSGLEMIAWHFKVENYAKYVKEESRNRNTGP